jgi:hypothetical protein
MTTQSEHPGYTKEFVRVYLAELGYIKQRRERMGLSSAEVIHEMERIHQELGKPSAEGETASPEKMRPSVNNTGLEDNIMRTPENQPNLPSSSVISTIAYEVDDDDTYPTDTDTPPATFDKEEVNEEVNSSPNSESEHAMLQTYCRERYRELEELLEFAVEVGKLDPPSLAPKIKSLKKMLYSTSKTTVTTEQFCSIEASMEMLYTKMAQLVAPVTVYTLRATSPHYPVPHPKWIAWFLGNDSLGRNFLRQLFWVGVLMLAVVFLGRFAALDHEEITMFDKFREFVVPFFYGAIGAWIYLYRTLSESYVNRSLNPSQASTNWLRMCMGALSGGLFVHLLLPQMQAMDTEGAMKLAQDNFATSAAIGLLAGYSVDLFYITLDRLINALLPKGENGAPMAPPPAAVTAKQVQMEALLKRLQEAQSEEDKATIRRMLEKL